MPTLFISDLHLDSSRPATLRAFLSFLQGPARRADALYILGDLFEAWIGDDDDSALATQVREGLQQLSHTVPVYVMHGNRDFLLGDTFCMESGCVLLADPTLIDIGGRQALLMHGDTLCTADTDYLAFREQVRQPAWQQALLAKPLAERRQIAAQLREGSREASSNKAEDIMDVSPAEVDRIMAEYGVDLLIHGHTHRPATHPVTHGSRIVLGDWDTNGWLIRWDRHGPELESFPIPA
ncbi:MAG: UDP-2,3-diacylglucosamine diphosphatase [Gammaproteobacteria bacterium]|nr:MAG: UDP-2,3-diacylglucosamine diphosphatase [Gammaproteobacteria bacterium]